MNVLLIAPSAALRLRLLELLREAAPTATVRARVVVEPRDAAAEVGDDDDVAVLAFGRAVHRGEAEELEAVRRVAVPVVLIAGPRSSGYHRAAWELGAHAVLSLDQHSQQALVGGVRAALLRTRLAPEPRATERILAARPDATVVVPATGSHEPERVEKRYRQRAPGSPSKGVVGARDAAFAWNALDAGVAVLDVFTRDDELVLVYERLGPRIVDSAPGEPSTEERVRSFQGLAESVCRMHSAGLPHGALAPRRIRVRADGTPCWLEPARLRPPDVFVAPRASTSDVADRLQEDLDALGAVFVDLCLPGACVGDDGGEIAWAMPVLDACSAPRRGRASRTARAVAEAAGEVLRRIQR